MLPIVCGSQPDRGSGPFWGLVRCGLSGFGGVGSVAASGAGVGAGAGSRGAAAGGFGVTSDFFGNLAAAFFAAGRLRALAALRPADLALRVDPFLPAALRFRVAADFFPGLLRLGLMSFLPCGMGLDPKSALYARPAFGRL